MKWLALIGMMVVLVGAAPPPTPGAGVLKFVDTTSDFDRIWNATKDLPDEKRVEAFEAAFAKVLPGFYEADRVKDFMDASRYRALVLEGLKNYPRRRAGIQRVSRQFRSLVEPAQRQFEVVFGPMRGYPPIYLVNSFGEFDGGTRDLAEGNRLMFGADMIDEIYMDKPMKPFVEHELFHLMHHRTFPECDPAWCNLWEEGLATFVASKLNPGAPDAALGLTIPEPLRHAVEGHRQEAICAVRTVLNSSDPKDYGPLFLGGGQPLSKNLPRRFGYYVGLMVVSDVAKHRTLKQLAALEPAQAHRLVERSLARMGHCPSAKA